MLNEALEYFGLNRKDFIEHKDSFLHGCIRRRLALSYFQKRCHLSDDEANELFFMRIITKEVQLMSR